MTNKAQYVYVITKGDYSDYHICAVTMDNDRAERMKKLYSDRYDEAHIEKYVLDETEAMAMYNVEFSEWILPEVTRAEYDFEEVTPVIYGFSDHVLVRVRAKDEDHALKIAQDEYAKWKAEKAGIV